MEVLTLDEFINSSGEKIMEIQIPHDDENFLGRFRVIDKCDCAEDKSYYFYAYQTPDSGKAATAAQADRRQS